MIRILYDLDWLHIFYSCIISDIARNIKICGNSALNHFEKRVLNYWKKLSEADVNKLSTMSGSVSAKMFFHISWNNAVYDMVLLLQFLVSHLPSVEPNFNIKTVFAVTGRHLYIERLMLQCKRNVCTCFAYHFGSYGCDDIISYIFHRADTVLA